MTSNDNKSDDPKTDPNVIKFKKPATVKKHSAPPNIQKPSDDEPLINMPPFTKFLLLGIVAVHLLVILVLSTDIQTWVTFHLGFIPARFTGGAEFEPLALLTPFTHMMLHGGWLHLGMNAMMLLAVGSGVERYMGGKKMIAFFIACGLCGVALHMALNPQSVAPVIGASGGISGLFAAGIVILNKRHGNIGGRFGLWPIIIVWVAISVIFGFVDSPPMGIESGDIAWAAHVGGFLGGFAVLKLMKIV